MKTTFLGGWNLYDFQLCCPPELVPQNWDNKKHGAKSQRNTTLEVQRANKKIGFFTKGYYFEWGVLIIHNWGRHYLNSQLDFEGISSSKKGTGDGNWHHMTLHSSASALYMDSSFIYGQVSPCTFCRTHPP